MKANLIFTLPEEADEFFLAQNGWKYKEVLATLDQRLRSAVKYDDMKDAPASLTGEQWQDAADAVRKLIGILTEEQGIWLYS